MCSESLGSEKVSYGPCAHQESCESLAAMAKFLVIRFDRTLHLPTCTSQDIPKKTAILRPLVLNIQIHSEVLGRQNDTLKNHPKNTFSVGILDV